MELYIDNDNYLELDGLKNGATSAYVNDAAVVCTLKDSSGNPVTGQTWPLTLAYVAASNGKYRGRLKYDLALTEGKTYTAHITATGGGLTANWQTKLLATKRRS
jgi:hypothetical protein